MFGIEKIIRKMSSSERISIAVVGIPASGKSYLLWDIVHALGSMGLRTDLLSCDGVQYRAFSQFSANLTSDGSVDQTEIYACRPKENIYGATIESGGQKMELTFVDIPGEVFSDRRKPDAKTGQTNIDVFVTYKNKLAGCSEKLFSVTEWSNPGGQVEYIVEPVMKGSRLQDHEQAKSTPAPASTFQKDRKGLFQPWDQLFGWLNQSYYEEQKRSRKLISGKTLLNNFFRYQPDSVMRSLGETVDVLCPELGLTTTDFSMLFMEQFYFLYYCSTATDIVVCDKLLVPNGNVAALPSDGGNINYDTLTQQLCSFIRYCKSNVYLAFRGVDFLLGGREEQYKKLISFMSRDGYTDDGVRNAVYSMFAYLLWNHVDPFNQIPQNELGSYLGLHQVPTGLTLESMEQKLIDLDCFANGEESEGLLGTIRAHVGGGPDNTFRQLLRAAYDYGGAAVGQPMKSMPPHVYFTSTPVSKEFVVYKNDSMSDNRRFTKEGLMGPKKYFDTAASNFCFGTYQLCLDILRQHHYNIDGSSEYGELLNLSMNS